MVRIAIVSMWLLAACEQRPEMVDDEPFVIRGEGTAVREIDDEGEVVVIGEAEPDEPRVFVPHLTPRTVPSPVVVDETGTEGSAPAPAARATADIPVIVPIAPTVRAPVNPPTRPPALPQQRTLPVADPPMPAGAAGDPRPITGATGATPGAAGDPGTLARPTR